MTYRSGYLGLICGVKLGVAQQGHSCTLKASEEGVASYLDNAIEKCNIRQGVRGERQILM